MVRKSRVKKNKAAQKRYADCQRREKKLKLYVRKMAREIEAGKRKLDDLKLWVMTGDTT